MSSGPVYNNTLSRSPRLKRGTVSIATVAQRAGVSTATVSRVMNGVTNKCTAVTADRVRQAIAELNYHPASVSRTLRSRQSCMVALLAANLVNPATAAIAASVEAALRRQGLMMVVCDTHQRPDIQDEYLLEMRAQMVRATVLLDAVASQQLTAMAHEPLLFVNHRDPDGRPLPYIGIDHHRAGEDVAAFFISRQIPVLGVIHGSRESSATSQRIAAFLDTLTQAGQPLPDNRVVTINTTDQVEIGYRQARTLATRPLADRQGGIFCSSDMIAYGAYRALHEAGLHVPRQVVLTGFDDNPLNDYVVPWLTSIRVPYERFGCAVVSALQSIWTGQPTEQIHLEHALVIRHGGFAPSAGRGSI